MDANRSVKSIAIIGGGASALFFAAAIDPDKFDVTIYEKNKTLGRKFLVAGDGGFNLTHSESIETMIERYTPSLFLKESLTHFDNTSLRNLLSEIGIETFIGSSKRVYPEKGVKPIEVLNAILDRIKNKGIEIKFEQTWTGWSEDKLSFNDSDEVNADIVVYALGGASWKVTGSNGLWISYFKQKNIGIVPFQASNCAFEVKWSQDFLNKNEGLPLKNIEITSANKSQRGEVVITSYGLEGNAIYALSPQIRNQLSNTDTAEIFIDLKPSLLITEIKNRLSSSSKNRTTTLSEEIKLSKVQVSLLKSFLTKEEFMDDEILSRRIKQFPVTISGLSEIDEAISTFGGVDLSEVSSSYELKNMHNHYCIGEMLNWDAPTGGYLIQACYSMGAFVAELLNEESTTLKE